MPRPSRIRTSALEDLAAQLRFAPKATVRRQIAGAMRLAQEVEAGRTYPEDEVVRRITGYAAAIPEPALLVGEALLGDLSAFVERLARGANLNAADAGPGALEIGELCRRWAVTRKSLERYRRRGLIALRIRAESGRERTLFPIDSVQWFERKHEDALDVAAKSGRMPQSLRERMLGRAARYRSRLGLSTTAIAARLATRFGKSREGVRRLLARQGGAAAPRMKIEESQRRALWRAWHTGASPRDLARRWARTVASVHRLVNQERAAMLRAMDLGGAAGDFFEDSRAGDALLDDEVLRSGMLLRAERHVADFVSGARADGPVSAQREATIASGYLLLRFRAAKAIAGLSRTAPASSSLDGVETMLRWAARLKALLVQSQRALILRTIEERLGGPIEMRPAEEAETLLVRAVDAAGAAVDQFDPFKGGRLAAPVSIVLVRSMKGAGGGGKAALIDWPKRVAQWQAWLEPPVPLEAAMKSMDSRRREVIEARYGLGDGRPLTLEEVKKKFGVTEERLAGWVREGMGQRKARRRKR